MKKLLFLALAMILTFPSIANAQLNYDLQGKILLQVEANGEAWYVYPKDLKRYYLGRPADAFSIMRTLGLGIKHDELQSYLDTSFPSRLSGYIMLDVEANGEAYYVFPDDRKGYYLGRPADAFQIMREKGLGISNADLTKIPVSTSSPEPEIDTPVVTPTPEPTPATSTENGSLTDPTSTLTVAYADLEKRAFDLINDHRESIGASRLVWKDVIAEQARNHSINIAEGIIDPSHDGFEDRVAAIERSIPYNGAAENLAWNNHTDQAQAALDWWLTSPEHKASLENSTYDYTGIGVAKTNGTIYYFTQIFINVD
jgi:uncharacterized protein YkwD